MAGSYEKRKPFQGKKFHKDLREFKSQEIKRSLVHRARLRKNYFKLIDEEKKDLPVGHEDAEPQQSGSESEENDSKQSAKQLRALPPQRAPPPEKTKKNPLNFAERAKLAKERKEQQREEKIQRVQERRRALERKNLEREKRKERLSQKTKTGQPVMGPKISNLLDKIRQGSS